MTAFHCLRSSLRFAQNIASLIPDTSHKKIKRVISKERNL